MDLLLYIPLFVVFVISFTTHETAHAWVADRLGDPTARQAGKVTLNPLPHIDPLMTIVVPIVLVISTGFMFGGARPVPFTPSRFKHPARDVALVAAAGPLWNLFLAVLSAALLSALVHAGVFDSDSDSVWPTVLAVSIWLNVLLLVFNILPVPPLDGSKVMASVLPSRIRQSYLSLEYVAFFVLIVVLWQGNGFQYLNDYALRPLTDMLTGAFGVTDEFIAALVKLDPKQR